ncbi:hypothetical protein RHODOSMS8_00027 [Rhodobiaceae bacterium]|nr:hypothetical protein RHODOSMS8_00027 [Rhodobiaceae bacterium]
MPEKAQVPTKAKKTSTTVPLTEPFDLSGNGENKIDKLTIRRPTPGDLRGLSIGNLLQADADTYYEYLPRVLTPALTSEQVVAHVDIADLMSLIKATNEMIEGK